MKIVCDSCGAKYSIADEKVRGKVFKIRCKKCSDVIVVKGQSNEGSGSEQSQQDEGFDDGYASSGGASEWYAVIEGDQVGPITPDEVEAYFKEGVLEEDSYAWREGLDDWQRLDELDAFSHLTDAMAGPEDETIVADSPVQSGLGGGGGGGGDETANPDERTVVTEPGQFDFESPDADAAAGGDFSSFDDSGSAKWEDTAGLDDEPSPSVEISDDYGQEAGVQASADQQGAAGGSGGGFESFEDQGGIGDSMSDPMAGEAQTGGDGGFDSGAGSGMDSGDSGLGGGFDSGGSGLGGDFESGSSGLGGEFESGSSSMQSGSSGMGGGMESGQSDSGGNAFGGMSSTGGNDEMAASGTSDAGGGSSFESFSGGTSGQSAVSGSGGGSGQGSGGSSQQGPKCSGSKDDLVGQRSENSVLFSLSSVDEMKAVDGPSQDEDVSGAGATTEGSGLIDIQSLAATHAAMSSDEEQSNGQQQQAAAPSPAAPNQQFSNESMNMPTLAPSGSRGNNLGLIIAVVVGFIFLSGAVVAAVLIINRDDEPKKIVQKKAAAPAADKKEESEGAGDDSDSKKEGDKDKVAEKKKEGDEKGEDGKKDENSDEEKKDEEKAENDEGSSSSDDDDDEPSRTASNDDDDDDHGGRADDPAPTPTRTGSSGSSGGGGGGGGGGDDIDSLLNSVDKGSKGGGGGGGGSEPEPKKDLPKRPSRSMVKNTIAKYSSRISGCKSNKNRNNLAGSIFIKFRIQPSGRVSGASIRTAKFKGTDVGKCVQRVVSSMKFPETQNGMPVKFPF